jgi:hypothetical protein
MEIKAVLEPVENQILDAKVAIDEAVILFRRTW